MLLSVQKVQVVFIILTHSLVHHLSKTKTFHTCLTHLSYQSIVDVFPGYLE